MGSVTGSVSAAIGAHHRELTEKLAAEVAAIETGKANASALVAFLKDELLPHAAGEEQYLYPVMDQLVKEYGRATATMTIDHEHIGAMSRRIEELAAALAAATTDTERDARRQELARLGAQLEAVLRIHVEKEERAYLPLFEAHLPSAEQHRLLDAMHERADAETSPSTTTPSEQAIVDVRVLPPAQRHALIFRTFEALPTGAAFVLVNDHDPKPLYYQLNFEYRGQLLWEYLEEGPDDWRVRIGKTA